MGQFHRTEIENIGISLDLDSQEYNGINHWIHTPTNLGESYP